MAKCCICDREVNRDDAPVLFMGGAGNAHLLCEECEALLNSATLGRDVEEIKQAMGKIGHLMADGNPDTATFSLVSQMMADAANRAKAIKEGSYDFSLDEATAEEGFDEIPEELRESEEDIELDRIEEENNKKFDKFYNGVIIAASIALGLFLVWKLLEGLGVDFSQFFAS
jgi:hypothetical protein